MLARVCLPVFAWHFTGFVTFPWVQLRQSPKGVSRRCQQIVSHCTYLPFNASIALARRRAPLWMQQLRMAASLQGSKATLLGQRTLGRWTVWCQREKEWAREWTTVFLHLSTQGFLTCAWKWTCAKRAAKPLWCGWCYEWVVWMQ